MLWPTTIPRRHVRGGTSEWPYRPCPEEGCQQAPLSCQMFHAIGEPGVTPVDQYNEVHRWLPNDTTSLGTYDVFTFHAAIPVQPPPPPPWVVVGGALVVVVGGGGGGVVPPPPEKPLKILVKSSFAWL